MSLTLLEPGITEWRRAHIDDDGFPDRLDYLPDARFDATGAIFDARVTKVDAGQDLAFLDLGEGRVGVMNQRRARLLKKGRSLSIRESVTEGERLKVQAVHDPQAQDGKSISVTPRPKLTGRYVVVEAGSTRLNFSKDLGPAAVKRLTDVMGLLGEHAAIVVRGRAGDVDEDAVAEEAGRLVLALTNPVGEPGLTFAFSPLEQGLMDLDDADTPIMVEGGTALQDAKALANRAYPDLEDRIELARTDGPMMEAFGVEESIEEALAERIELPSGGWLSLHPTPALTAIDVNMGAAWKSNDAAEAKLMVNQEAAMAIAWHLRFQNIGGLIVIDFIDMSGKNRLATLMDTLKGALGDDPVPVQVSGMSGFGLVQLNRPRRGVSLRERLQRARGPVDQPQAVVADLVRAAVRAGARPEVGCLVISAPEAVVKTFEADPRIADALAHETGRTVRFEIGPKSVQVKE